VVTLQRKNSNLGLTKVLCLVTLDEVVHLVCIAKSHTQATPKLRMFLPSHLLLKFRPLCY
jgi:hypothetical protein